MSVPAVITVLCVLGCAAGLPALTRFGMRALELNPLPRWALALLIPAGAGLAALALMTSRNLDSLAVVPALGVWMCTLVAAAICDARSQRMPTALLRWAWLTCACLLTLASLVTSHWDRLLRAAIVSCACWALLWLGWKLSSLGRADARLAALAGLGLGWIGLTGALAGVLAFCLITALQVVIVLARGGTRNSHLPYGPALAAGFVVAALLA